MIVYLYWGLTLLGFVLLYFSYTQYNKTRVLVGTGTSTKATVIEHIRVHDSDGDTFRARFKYQDKQNAIYNFETDYSSRPAPYKIGQELEIVYNSDHSKRAVVSFWGLHRWSIILLCFALPLLIIGVGYILYTSGNSVRIL